MKQIFRIVALLVVLAAGYWLWRTFFPGDEAIIRRQLTELAEAASFPANEAPLAKLGNAGKVAGYFTADTEIDIAPWGYSRVVINGHQELQAATLGARNAVSSLSVGVENVVVNFNPDRAGARIRLTLVGSTSRSPEQQSQEMELELLKLDGEWLIHRVRTFDYLK